MSSDNIVDQAALRNAERKHLFNCVVHTFDKVGTAVEREYVRRETTNGYSPWLLVSEICEEA